MSLVREVLQGAPSYRRLRNEILREFEEKYVGSANEFLDELRVDSKFTLEAKWKLRDISKKASRIAKSLQKTIRKQLPKNDPAAAKRYLQYKLRQLIQVIIHEAQFMAEVDIVAHSGLLKPNAKVMYFIHWGAHEPCPQCREIIAGNPYTIQHATTLGAIAHPNCQCAWHESWEFAEDTFKDVPDRFASGEIDIWTGTGRTPTQGSARKTAARLREHSGGWRGRRTQQRIDATRRRRSL